MKTISDWNGNSIQIVKSRGGVITTAVPEENLVRSGISPWPPAEIVQKLYQSRQLRAFDEDNSKVATNSLGFYTDLQSLHSEDAITWSVFGPLIYGDEKSRRKFTANLFDDLNLSNPIKTPVRMWLWRRLPHPDNLVPGGPEIDFGIQTMDTLVLGESKWRSAVSAAQGLNKDKNQITLRREFCEKYGLNIYPQYRHFVILGLSLYGGVTADADANLPNARIHLRDTTWKSLCRIRAHPLNAELHAYYEWKLSLTQSVK